MKRMYWLWVMGVCAIGCVLGAKHWFSPAPIHAQQNTGYYDDGTFYMTAFVDVDSNYNLHVSSYMQVQFDDYENIDEIEVDGYADQDGGIIGSGASNGDDNSPAAFSLSSNSPVATGHEYGMESDGFACYDDGEGNCGGFDYVGSTYASVNIATPTPQIASLSPSSVNQGDNGTLTISGSNLVENAGDQLTINYSGSGMPFTLTGTPSSGTASFSYDFTGYTPGSYTLSVTNNEGTSNSESFTVNAPLNACSQSTVPNAVTFQIPGFGNQNGTFTVSHPTAMAVGAATSVSYGPSSTPESVASSIASAITRNYLHLGMTAQANGSNVTIQSRSLFGAISGSSSGSTISIGMPTSISCFVPPTTPLPCDGLTPDYNTSRLYKGNSDGEGDGGGITETPRQHIIRKHILGTPSLGPPQNTVYAKPPGLTTGSVFGIVVGHNVTTVLLSLPQNGAYTRTFPKYKLFGVEFGFLGNDAADNDLYTNKLFLTPDRCTIKTSYPVLP